MVPPATARTGIYRLSLYNNIVRTAGILWWSVVYSTNIFVLVFNRLATSVLEVCRRRPWDRFHDVSAQYYIHGRAIGLNIYLSLWRLEILDWSLVVLFKTKHFISIYTAVCTHDFAWHISIVEDLVCRIYIKKIENDCKHIIYTFFFCEY